MELNGQAVPEHPRIRSVETFNVQRPAAPVLVVIPTYNELDNIEAILQALNLPDFACDVIVVDDGSPDGTADRVAAIASSLPRRVLLMRRNGKFGLGVAYLDAHRWIIGHAPEYRFIVQMDADFSHDPHMIPLLVREAGAYGAAIGSRYVAGGSAPDWNRQRLLLSWGANTYLKIVLKLFFPPYPVRDNTSGFIAWRRDVLESVLRYPIFGDGYSFLTSLKLVAYRVGYPPHEIPIVLHDRRLGVSKLNRHIMLEAFKMPWKLGWTFRDMASAALPTRPVSAVTAPADAGPEGHDNSVEMWRRYYASEDETGGFAKLVHWAREHYFGDLFARHVVRYGGPASTYLELGAGTAQTLARVQRRTGARCTGIEITPSAYELGKAFATNCEMVLGDGMRMPFPDRSFDVVYSLGLLEHFGPDEQAALLREQARVARNAVVVEVPFGSPHMRAIMWFNRTVLKKKGVWADEELFSAAHFREKYPGLPFEYHFDWASGCLTCWFVLKPDDVSAHVPAHASAERQTQSGMTAPAMRSWKWWFGVPVFAGLVSWLPYWGWNLLGGATGYAWWRVPVTTTGLFDSYVYLHWMSAAALRLPYGGHLKWFDAMLVGLWGDIGSWASFPELWIISRWITFTLTIWIGAWAFEKWPELSTRRARLYAIAFFSALILTLGMRPGVYAWDLPFCILGLLFVFFASGALRRRAWLAAAAWSIASAALTWIYPWFFLVAGVWLAVEWGVALVRVRTWALGAAMGLFAVLVGAASLPLARWFLLPARAALIGVYERNGVAFTHIPFLANTVIAIGAWIAFLFALVSCTNPSSDGRRKLIFLAEGWIVILLLWFQTPFIGIHLYSDHFISPVTVLAWITLAAVWVWARNRGTGDAVPSRFMKLLTLVVTLGATAFFLYVLQQPIRFNLSVFSSYVIHLAHWFALAAAGWIVLWRFRHPASVLSDRIVAGGILLPAIAIGLSGLGTAFVHDLPDVREASAKAPIVDWIRTNVPAGDAMCADPASASFYAAHTGRRVNPAEATLSWPDTSEQVVRNMETLVGAYDVRASGNVKVFRFYTDNYRPLSCEHVNNYSHNAPYGRVLAKLGFNAGQVNDLIGCDMATIDRNRARVDAAMDARAPDPQAFRALCPWVIIPDAQKAFWALPSGYTEQRIAPDLSIWQTR